MNRKNLPTVIFDCMIYLQGLIKETGPAVDCLELFERHVINLVVSDEILNEIRNVLTRPKLQTQYSRLSTERADKLLDILKGNALVVENVPEHFKYPRDPKDEKYINLAIEVKADYIVSRDKDLLDLMTSYADEAKEFRQKFRDLKIIDPVEFIRIIEEMGLALKP